MQIQYSGEAIPDGTASYVIDSDGVFLAYGESGTSTVTVAYLRNQAAPTLSLQTSLQRKPVTAVCLGQGTLGSSDPAPHAAVDATQALLCVASQDSVVCWQLAAAYAAAADDQPLPEPIQVMSRQGQVDAIIISSIDQPEQHLVICAGIDIHVFQLRTLRNTHRLEGHHAPVLAACFCEPHHRHLLVTAGEDRSFKVWDLQEGVMMYQSAILSAAPLTAVAVDPSYPRMAVGSSDGVVRFFDLAGLPACRCLQAVDLSKQLQKVADKAADVVSSIKAAAADGPVVVTANKRFSGVRQDEEEDQVDAPVVIAGNAGIIRLFYLPLTSGSADSELLGQSPKLLVGTTKALAVLDTQTYELDEGHFLKGGAGSDALSMGLDAYLKLSGLSPAAANVSERLLLQFRALPECSPAGAYAFAWDPSLRPSAITCCISAAFEPLITIFSVTPAGSRQADDDDSPSEAEEVESQNQASTISVFPNEPLPLDSVLRSSTSSTASFDSSKGAGSSGSLPGQLPRSSSSGRGSTQPAAPIKRGSSPGSGTRSTSLPRAKSSGTATATSSSSKDRNAVVNQPVTFNKKIKSSGYGFVQPQVRMGAAPKPLVKVSKALATSAVAKHLLQQRQYPVDCAAPVQRQAQHVLPGNAAVHGSAILRALYSSDASRILTASADRTARVMKLPLSKYQGEGTDLIAHNAAVLSASWSHDGTMVLTASADRTARMWNAGCAQPLLEFTHMIQQVSPLASGTTLPPLSPPPPSSSRPVLDAANKAFVHEVRAAHFFYMDQFVLLATGNKLNLYRFKLSDGGGDDIERLRNLNKYKLAASYGSASQTINAVSCYNSFLSPLALIAGSNRSVEVVDVSTMQSVTAIEDTHIRPPHTIVQSISSLFVSHPKESYELFATASQDNTAKLWDLRTSRCVRTFTGHKNSQIATNIAFSPCLRYLASGSEDKAAYLYDLRMGSVLHRIRGHGDAVMDIAFNPLHPQIAVCCLDGKIHFYSDVL